MFFICLNLYLSDKHRKKKSIWRLRYSNNLGQSHVYHYIPSHCPFITLFFFNEDTYCSWSSGLENLPTFLHRSDVWLLLCVTGCISKRSSGLYWVTDLLISHALCLQGSEVDASLPNQPPVNLLILETSCVTHVVSVPAFFELQLALKPRICLYLLKKWSFKSKTLQIMFSN